MIEVNVDDRILADGGIEVVEHGASSLVGIERHEGEAVGARHGRWHLEPQVKALPRSPLPVELVSPQRGALRHDTV